MRLATSLAAVLAMTVGSLWAGDGSAPSFHDNFEGDLRPAWNVGAVEQSGYLVFELPAARAQNCRVRVSYQQ